MTRIISRACEPKSLIRAPGTEAALDRITQEWESWCARNKIDAWPDAGPQVEVLISFLRAMVECISERSAGNVPKFRSKFKQCDKTDACILIS